MRLAAAFLTGDELLRVNAQASKAVAMALELDPDLAAAHAARGQQAFAIDLDWKRAMAEYHEGLRLAPNDGSIKVGQGIALAAEGHVAQGLEATRQGLAVDPLNGRGYLTLARFLSGLGRLDEAEAAIRKSIELQPSGSANYHQLASILIQRGDAKAALSAAMKEPAGAWRDFAVALARQVAGDPAAGDAALKSLIDTWADNAAYQVAQTYALRRDPDRMFEWLDRAWTARDPGIVYLLADPIILRYRDDPRFAAFCRKVGLPETTDARGMAR
jgi:tetratricopeptide (TPR) repeat protein